MIKVQLFVKQYNSLPNLLLNGWISPPTDILPMKLLLWELAKRWKILVFLLPPLTI